VSLPTHPAVNHADDISNSAQGLTILDIHTIATDTAQSLRTVHDGLQYCKQASESSRLSAEQTLTLVQASVATIQSNQRVADADDTCTGTAAPTGQQLQSSPASGQENNTLVRTQGQQQQQQQQPTTSEMLDLSGLGLVQSQPDRDSVVCVNATVRMKCNNGCRCQCHVARRKVSSPSWLGPVLGSVLFGYNSLPFLDPRPCDEPQCLNARSFSSLSLTYRFPAWLWDRVLVLTAARATMNHLGGPGASLHLRVPRVVYPNDSLWILIKKNEITKIKMAFSQRLYRPIDVGQSGNSIFHWSMTRRGFGTVAFLMEEFLEIYQDRSQDMHR